MWKFQGEIATNFSIRYPPSSVWYKWEKATPASSAILVLLPILQTTLFPVPNG